LRRGPYARAPDEDHWHSRERPSQLVKYPNPPVSPCCNAAQACVFSKALVARAATCQLAQRTCEAEGEQAVLSCTSPVARSSCGALATLLHERARSALRLPPPGRPLIHVQALRLQCTGLAALQQVLVAPDGDIRRMVVGAQERHGDLAELPWGSLVTALSDGQPRSRPTDRD
jgi:hypothetical protein